MVAVSLKKKKQKKIFFFFFFFFSFFFFFFFFQAEDGIRDRSPSRGLGDVYKRQELNIIVGVVVAIKGTFLMMARGPQVNVIAIMELLFHLKLTSKLFFYHLIGVGFRSLSKKPFPIRLNKKLI